MRTKKARTTLYLSRDLWTRVRLQAIREQCTASAIVERLLAAYLKGPAKKGGRHR